MLLNSKKRVYVLSYDDSSITKSDVVEFLLKNGVFNIESYTDSTIHFEWKNNDFSFWFDLIKKNFPKMVFSINLIARSEDPHKQYFNYIKGSQLETDFITKILNPLKKELGLN